MTDGCHVECNIPLPVFISESIRPCDRIEVWSKDRGWIVIISTRTCRSQYWECPQHKRDTYAKWGGKVCILNIGGGKDPVFERYCRSRSHCSPLNDASVRASSTTTGLVRPPSSPASWSTKGSTYCSSRVANLKSSIVWAAGTGGRMFSSCSSLPRDQAKDPLTVCLKQPINQLG